MTAHDGHWSRLASARLSRRRALAGGTSALAALAAATVVGCGRHDSASLAATPAPRRGGTLRRGTALPVAYGLDPHLERGAGLAIFPRIFGYLHHVYPQRDDALVLDHASSIEQPDATTIVVRLRGDVHFQPAPPVQGRAVVAGDAKASIERYRDHPVVVQKLWHKAVLDAVDASEDRVLRVTTRIPYVYSLQQLGDLSAGAILPRELVEAAADFSRGAPGSGPFSADRADPAAGQWRITRFAGYFAQPLPYLDAMTWTVFGGDDAKLAAFERGDVDQVDDRDLAESQAAARLSRRVVIDSQPSLASVALGLRIDAPPFNDERIRRAVDLSVDRDALIRDIAPGDGRVLGPVNPHIAQGFWSLPEAEVRAASEASVPIEERRAEAAALVRAAGTVPMTFEMQAAATPRMIDVATTLRDQCGRAGFDVRIAELPELDWFANFNRGAFQAAVISHAPYETPDLPLRFLHSRGPAGNGNPFGLSDPAIDRMIDESSGQFDRSERQRTILGAQRLMVASRAMLQLFTSNGYSASWEYVQGREAGVIGAMAQYNYGLWLNPARGAPKAR